MVIVEEYLRRCCIFNESRQTWLTNDWSKNVISFYFFQKHCACITITPPPPPPPPMLLYRIDDHLLKEPVYTPSRVMSYPHQGWSIASADTLDKARHFVIGCDSLIIMMDHTPFIKFYGSTSFWVITNSRWRNLKEKILCHRLKMMYIPGVCNKASSIM